jgi:hypothetical protein
MAAGMVYRDYALFSDGMLMVFSSYGEGDDASLTSAREFRFFPRAIPLELRTAGERLSVRMTDGGEFAFDPAASDLSSVERGEVTVSPRVDPAERGGVEFPRYAGLLLDSGFRRGELPSMRPEAESTFRDARGHLCAVANRELFAYADGEREFRFDDAALSARLAVLCPGLAPGF